MMKKSIDKLSSDKSSIDLTTMYSHKRYFINNLDSYHGEYFVKEVAKVFEKNNVASTRDTSQSLLGEDVALSEPPPPEQPYEIIGTAVTESTKDREFVTRIVRKEDSIRQMLTCGTVIFDISVDREELKLAMEYLIVLKQLLEKQALTGDDDAGEPSVATGPDIKKRYLILISTVMTWASTKPLDPLGCPVSRALVVASGVTYGGKEDVLFYWFQKAWECEPILPILGRGNNTVPLINIVDLGKIVRNLLLDFPKKLYLLAVEQNVSKQRDIVKPLGRQVGSGMFKCIPPEDAFLIPELDQRIYDLMTLNLNMEPTFIVETMGLQWTFEGTFADNIPVLMKQFKKERGLKPFKIVIYGPPICGKTSLAISICDAYGLVYISPETVAQDMLEDLTWRVEHWDIGEMVAITAPNPEEEDIGIADDEDQGEDDLVQEQARQNLAILQSGRPLSEEEIIMYLRQKLLSREAMNRGWVLDGFPMTQAQCQIIFEKGDEQDSEAGEETRDEPFDEDVDLYNNVLKKLLPDIVVSLDANDEFICEKAMRLPEGHSRLDEETILKRLSEFRAGDTRENTPLNFFDELDIHPLVVPVKDHTDYGMQGPYTAVALRMGRPCRYGKLLALIEAAEKKEKYEQETLKTKEAKALKEMEDKLRSEREDKMEYWTELYAMMREEEEAALAAAGEPMRNYLVQHIFPTLTPALLEVAKLRPDDPIDFLAEKTFKLNPLGMALEEKCELHDERMKLEHECTDEMPKEATIPLKLDAEIDTLGYK
ncbi:hypothetical protein HF086_003743 [Spodoptera exigua]|uniref:Adenylate kinase 7 n=1 Tax=Spodoptera exigua TaxID=7107 RepID=A0A922MWT5_SPOEX|nr:hypothetical protein HF086_003743 [Spodoptera exigua]